MKVLTNAFWLSTSRLLADVLSFALFTVISRIFGPAGTGEYSYAFAVATLLALTSTAGLEDYGIRQYARAPRDHRAQLWSNILSTQCVQLIVGLSALAIFLLTSTLGSRGLVVVLELSIYVIGWSMSRTLFVPAMAAQAMVRPAITDLSCRFAAILCALLLVYLAHPSLPWLLAGFPVAGVSLALLALRSAKAHGAAPRLTQSWQGVIVTLRGTSSFAGSEILNQFYARADLLLIAYFLGNARVGLYATDIKFVEVGLLPLIFFGTAAYPLLSTLAGRGLLELQGPARDFTRIVFFFSGWLAVGIYWLIPLLIVPLFGEQFAPAIRLLPWVALFAVMKGWEVAFYRLLYVVHRQAFYLGSLLLGTVLIVLLNLHLIPKYGILGAILAATVSIFVVDSICAYVIRRHVGTAFLIFSFVRLVFALSLTAAVVLGAQQALHIGPWTTALAACALFPLIGALLGLLPNPRYSQLLRQPQAGAS
jgi:O-antigen/teichoic acid export membrane protein